MKCEIHKVGPHRCRRAGKVTRYTQKGYKVLLCKKCDTTRIGDKTIGEIVEERSRTEVRDDTKAYVKHLNEEAARYKIPIKITAHPDHIDDDLVRIEVDYSGHIPEVARRDQNHFTRAVSWTEEQTISYLRGLEMMIFMCFVQDQVHNEKQWDDH
jgi:hypothetical protein